MVLVMVTERFRSSLKFLKPTLGKDMSLQTHLVRSRKPYGQYYYICYIPKDLIEVLGTKVFRVSLKNSQYSHSKRISDKLHNVTQSIFGKIRQGLMRDLTIEDVKNVLRIEVRKSLLHIHHVEYGTNIFDEIKLNESLKKVEVEESKLKNSLSDDYKNVLKKMEREIDQILLSLDLEPDKSKVEYKGLVRKWVELKLMRTNWKRELINQTGKTDEDFRKEVDDKWKMDLFSSVSNDSFQELTEPVEIKIPPKTKSKKDSPLLSEGLERYLGVMKLRMKRNNTIEETRVTFEEFVEIFGDREITEYTSVDGRDYRDILIKFPKNRKKVKRYRDKSLKEIIKMEVPPSERISLQTQTKLQSRLKTLWNYFLQEYPEFISQNIFQSPTPKIKRLEKDRKQDFTPDEIQTIFNPNVYIPFIFNNKKHDKYRSPYYWVPIISSLTGCRVEEICQMETESIIKVNGVWIYRLRELGESEEENPKVKNLYSERDIPLHDVLVDELNFIGFVKRKKSKGHKRVFHELPYVNNKYQKNVIRFFNERYLKYLGLKGTKKVSFHSLRHSVETHLTNKRVHLRFLDYLQGHVQTGEGGKTYLHKIQPEILKDECVDKISWNVDWKKMKMDWKSHL